MQQEGQTADEVSSRRISSRDCAAGGGVSLIVSARVSSTGRSRLRQAKEDLVQTKEEEEEWLV
jgi:hypothetical protein